MKQNEALWKRYMRRGVLGLLLFVLAVLLYLALAPVKIMSSSVFTSPGLTEIRLYVVTNSLLPAGDIENAGNAGNAGNTGNAENTGNAGNAETLARQIVREHQKQNGPRADGVYELRLYRTEVHYILHREYAYLFCDASGNLLPRPTAGTNLLHSARSAPSLLPEKPV